MRFPQATALPDVVDLIHRGELDAAERAIGDRLATSTVSRSTFEEGVELLARAGFGDAAQEGFGRYEARFGEPPPEVRRTDLGVLVGQRHDADRRLDRGEPLVAHRLTLANRGWPGRYAPLHPRIVRRLAVTPSGLEVKTSWRRWSCRWSDLNLARLERREDVRLLAFTQVKYEKRVLVLSQDGNDVQVRLDLSTFLPEFERPDLIEATIRKYLPVEDLDLVRFDGRRETRREWMIGTAIVTASLAVLFAEYWGLL